MSEPSRPSLRISQKPDTRLRAQLVARIRTIQLLKKPESEIAGLLKELESDPLFRKILHAPSQDWKLVRFQPHPRARLAASFYEFIDGQAPAAGGDAEGFLEKNADVIKLIKRLGQDAFERYFLRAESDAAAPDLEKRLGISAEDIRRVSDFCLTFSVHADVFGAPPTKNRSLRVACLARLAISPDKEVSFEFLAPHLARGRYDINYDRLKNLMVHGKLSDGEKRALKGLVRRLELVNWRQNILFRLLDYLCHWQRFYIATGDLLKRQPITQRQLAKKLSVAPSTINRAIQARSVILPSGEEVLLESLFCARKDIVLEALDAMSAADPGFAQRTDADVRKALEKEWGLLIPRRTVNTHRRLLSEKR